jgi:ribulose kinase
VVQPDYWDVEDGQVAAKTGKPLAHWMKVLAKFGAASKKTMESVEHLQSLGVPRYWARTLTTHFLKKEA